MQAAAFLKIDMTIDLYRDMSVCSVQLPSHLLKLSEKTLKKKKHYLKFTWFVHESTQTTSAGRYYKILSVQIFNDTKTDQLTASGQLC